MLRAHRLLTPIRGNDKTLDMASHASIADFLMTGCAVLPAVALDGGRADMALLTHIVLLFASLGFAACEQDAPLESRAISTGIGREGQFPARTGPTIDASFSTRNRPAFLEVPAHLVT